MRCFPNLLYILTGHHREVYRIHGTVSHPICDLVFADALVHSRVLARKVLDRQARVHGVIVLLLLELVLHVLFSVWRQGLACKRWLPWVFFKPWKPGVGCSVQAIRARSFLLFIPSGPWRERKTEVANELAMASSQSQQRRRRKEARKESPKQCSPRRPNRKLGDIIHTIRPQSGGQLYDKRYEPESNSQKWIPLGYASIKHSNSTLCPNSAVILDSRTLTTGRTRGKWNKEDDYIHFFDIPPILEFWISHQERNYWLRVAIWSQWSLIMRP